VKLRAPASDGGEGSFDERLRAAFDKHTKAIIVNTPNNPTEKFSRGRVELIRDLVRGSSMCSALTDEIYEHILF